MTLHFLGTRGHMGRMGPSPGGRRLPRQSQGQAGRLTLQKIVRNSILPLVFDLMSI
jgi:hypothetical protein